MKLLDLIQAASSNTLRSKARTILTVIAIFIGAMTLTLTNGIGSGIASYIDEQLGNIGAEDVLLVQGKSDNPFGGGGPQKYDENVTVTNASGFPMTVLTPTDLERIKSQPGIKSADFDINTAPDFIAGPDSEKYKLTPSTYIDGLRLTMAAGNAPSNRSDEHQVLLPPDYVSVLGFNSEHDAVGKKVTIGVKDPTGVMHEVEATVSGVQDETIVNAGGIVFNRALSNAIYDLQTQGIPKERKDQQALILARFDPDISESSLNDIKKGLDEKGYTSTTLKDQIGIFKQVINAVIMVLNFFAGIALLAASFGIVNTLLMAVQERTKEIGLMKALGMSGRKVFLLFSIEAVLLGFWGSLLGSLAGIGIGKIANKVASDGFLKDLTGFELTSFPWQSVAVIMLIVMTIAFIAGTLPARRASKKDPIEALRYE